MVITKFGYDWSRGRQDKSAHPFTQSFGQGDVRITTRLRHDFLNTALFGTMHEAGHAMYEQGIRAYYRGDGRTALRFFDAALVEDSLFALAAYSGASIAFVFFVWVSIYGVMVVAQLWAFAADTFNLKSGQRLFPVIMVGANVGALVGAKTAQLAVASLTPVGLMVVATCALAATLLFAGPERRAVPDGSRAAKIERSEPVPRLLGGIGLVLRDHYLLLIALLVVLLNWINTTGEFILADFVQRDADLRVAASGGTLDKGTLIAAFYGDFQFWVTVAGLAIQLFLVSRIYRTVGVRGALLIHPVIVAFGYGLLALSPVLGGFVPIFTLIRLIKIGENSIDYSLMNTTRHALFLPVDRDAKYEGKTAIDTCLWLLEIGVPPSGIRWIKPRESWLQNRVFSQGGELVGTLFEGISLQVEAAARATSVDDLFARLSAAAQVLRVDENVTPTMYKGATASPGEIDQLRCIEDVRRGRVRRTAPRAAPRTAPR